MNIIDLSKSLYTGMQVYPGDPAVEVKVVHTHEEHTWELRELHLGSHTGTHVDAFSHMHKHGKNLDDIPLSRFFGPASVVKANDVFPQGMGLFFTDDVGVELVDRILIAQAPFVGGEISEGLERALLQAEIVTYTNLVNLELIPEGQIFTFYGLPLKIRAGDGSPVRAIAIID